MYLPRTLLIMELKLFFYFPDFAGIWVLVGPNFLGILVPIVPNYCTFERIFVLMMANYYVWQPSLSHQT